MADFVSEFWNIWIMIGAGGGIAAMFWLVKANSTDARKDGKAEATGHIWDTDLKELNNPLPYWWLMMFYITLVFSVIYLILYPGFGSFAGVLDWSSKASYETEVETSEANYAPLFDHYLKQDLKPLAADRTAMRTGERLFVNYCAVCHGSDARGAKGFPNLRDAAWLYGGDPQQIKHSILHGRQGNMPAWEGPLGGEQGVEAMAHYVLSLSNRKHDAAKAAKAQPKWAFCIGCHGPTGTGNPALGAPNLTDNAWIFGSTLKDIRHSIAKGRSGRMPAHKAFLGEAKSHVLAAYVYSLSQ